MESGAPVFGWQEFILLVGGFGPAFVFWRLRGTGGNARPWLIALTIIGLGVVTSPLLGLPGLLFPLLLAGWFGLFVGRSRVAKVVNPA